MSFLAHFRDTPAIRRQSEAGDMAKVQYEFLAITPDIRFFSSLAYTMTRQGWSARCVRSLYGAERLECRAICDILRCASLRNRLSGYGI
jgi:hypothetical protein